MILKRIRTFELYLRLVKLYTHLHVECELHFLVQVTDINVNKAADEAWLCNETILLWVKNVEQSIVNNARKLCVLNKGDFVNFFLNRVGVCHASERQVSEEVTEVIVQWFFNKFGVKVYIKVFH